MKHNPTAARFLSEAEKVLFASVVQLTAAISEAKKTGDAELEFQTRAVLRAVEHLHFELRGVRFSVLDPVAAKPPADPLTVVPVACTHSLEDVCPNCVTRSAAVHQ